MKGDAEVYLKRGNTPEIGRLILRNFLKGDAEVYLKSGTPPEIRKIDPEELLEGGCRSIFKERKHS